MGKFLVTLKTYGYPSLSHLVPINTQYPIPIHCTIRMYASWTLKKSSLHTSKNFTPPSQTSVSSSNTQQQRQQWIWSNPLARQSVVQSPSTISNSLSMIGQANATIFVNPLQNSRVTVKLSETSSKRVRYLFLLRLRFFVFLEIEVLIYMFLYSPPPILPGNRYSPAPPPPKRKRILVRRCIHIRTYITILGSYPIPIRCTHFTPLIRVWKWSQVL